MKCNRCKRDLKSPNDKNPYLPKGYGVVCGRKMAAETAMKEEAQEQATPMIVGEAVFNGLESGIDVIWKRSGDRMQAGSFLRTNVRRVVTWHSPDGFEVGYGGSGPADFALNILTTCVPVDMAATRAADRSEDMFTMNYVEPAGYATRCGSFAGAEQMASAFAVRYHQDFKWAFLASANDNEGRIDINALRAWVNVRLESWGDWAKPGANLATETMPGGVPVPLDLMAANGVTVQDRQAVV